MLVTYCDGCGILVKHPKVEVRVHCPDCHKRQEAMATRKFADPLPCAERMNAIGGDPLVQETARRFRVRRPSAIA